MTSKYKKRLGIRKLTCRLKREYGLAIGQSRVRRLFKQMNLPKIATKKVHTFSQKSVDENCLNLLKRQFYIEAPNLILGRTSLISKSAPNDISLRHYRPFFLVKLLPGSFQPKLMLNSLSTPSTKLTQNVVIQKVLFFTLIAAAFNTLPMISELYLNALMLIFFRKR